MKKGFTLLETLIYTALFSFMITGLILVMRATFQTRARTQAHFVLESNLRYALTRTVTRVHEATGIVEPASGATSTTLTLSLPNPPGGTQSITNTDGIVTLTVNGSPVALTSDEVEVTTLEFTHLTGTPEQVRITMSGRNRHAVGAYQTTRTLYETAAIRR